MLLLLLLLPLELPPSPLSQALHHGGARARGLHHQQEEAVLADEAAVSTHLVSFIHAAAEDHHAAEEEAVGILLDINTTHQMKTHFLHTSGQVKRENGVPDAEWRDTLQNYAGMDKETISNYQRKNYVKTQVPL